MIDFAIRTEDLTREFGSLRAVDGVSLEVPAGSIFGFLGPNGSGKTTTIRLLLGLLEPTRGGATVLGYDTRSDAGAVRERCGALLEHAGLYERMTARGNLDFYGRVWRLPPPDRERRIRELLEGLGLWDRRDEIVGAWSRGMKQKLAVARALLHRPKLVFLDEPTAGLDPIAAAALRDDLTQLARQEGVTVFLTTHNLAEAEKLCDQVAVIRAGRLLAVGPPDMLRSQARRNRVEITGRGLDERVAGSLGADPAVESAELGEGRLTLRLRDGHDSAPLVARLVHEGVAIDEVRKGGADLEEAFLALMETVA
ncbi:MAG TPA: ABC transporter ATP-binding protein [Candidatus Limnocylindrales bacterium]